MLVGALHSPWSTAATGTTAPDPSPGLPCTHHPTPARGNLDGDTTAQHSYKTVGMSCPPAPQPVPASTPLPARAPLRHPARLGPSRGAGLVESDLLVDNLQSRKGNIAAATRALEVPECVMGLGMRKHGVGARRFRTTKTYDFH